MIMCMVNQENKKKLNKKENHDKIEKENEWKGKIKESLGAWSLF